MLVNKAAVTKLIVLNGWLIVPRLHVMHTIPWLCHSNGKNKISVVLYFAFMFTPFTTIFLALMFMATKEVARSASTLICLDFWQVLQLSVSPVREYLAIGKQFTSEDLIAVSCCLSSAVLLDYVRIFNCSIFCLSFCHTVNIYAPISADRTDLCYLHPKCNMEIWSNANNTEQDTSKMRGEEELTGLDA